MTESLAMEVIANNLFNHRDDVGDLLARYACCGQNQPGNRQSVPPPVLPHSQ
jgi:hypothetical protein